MIDYMVRTAFEVDVGFIVNADTIQSAAKSTTKTLSELPCNLYQSIDYKTTSAIIGSIFCSTLASVTEGIVNPIEKGHPDLIPLEAEQCSEEKLRNYPQGLEVKCTVGNIEKGANLRAGEVRINRLTGITWQAHHREVSELMGLVWDFYISENQFYYPTITGIFYSNNLKIDDWGKISGTKGRNTKVSGLKSSGKTKMGNGWVCLINNQEYIKKYSKALSFEP